MENVQEARIPTPTKLNDIFDHIGEGNFAKDLATAFAEVAEKTCEHGRHGKEGGLKIELKFKPVADETQTVIGCKLTKIIPTNNGKDTRDYNYETAFFVGLNGNITPFAPATDGKGQDNMQFQEDDIL